MTLATAAALGVTPKEHLNELIKDTQKQGNRAGRVTLVWWMPPEFWEATFMASGTVPGDKAREILKPLSEINVFAVIDGKMNGLGAVDFAPESESSGKLAVLDTSGKPVAQVPEEKQSPSVKNLLGMMKPVLANMLGETGKHFAFVVFVFEAKDKDGARRIDPTKPGVLKVRFGAQEFSWRLPLGSVLPPKVCPKCGETFPGNYAYCPYDATQLAEQAVPKQ